MINSNILLVDNCKAHVENAKNKLLTLGPETTLYVAENDLEAWNKLQGNHKISPIPKFF